VVLIFAANDLLDEKEAEKRATMYRPKTPLKRERKLPFCRVSAFFYASLLQTGLCFSYPNARTLSISNGLFYGYISSQAK